MIENIKIYHFVKKNLFNMQFERYWKHNKQIVCKFDDYQNQDLMNIQHAMDKLKQQSKSKTKKTSTKNYISSKLRNE